jgi:hypothetical protein
MAVPSSVSHDAVTRAGTVRLHAIQEGEHAYVTARTGGHPRSPAMGMARPADQRRRGGTGRGRRTGRGSGNPTARDYREHQSAPSEQSTDMPGYTPRGPPTGPAGSTGPTPTSSCALWPRGGRSGRAEGAAAALSGTGPAAAGYPAAAASGLFSGRPETGRAARRVVVTVMAGSLRLGELDRFFILEVKRSSTEMLGRDPGRHAASEVRAPSGNRYAFRVPAAPAVRGTEGL